MMREYNRQGCATKQMVRSALSSNNSVCLMTASELIAKSTQYAEELQRLIVGCLLPSDKRIVTSVCLLHLGIEHHRAICHLVYKAECASAAALTRPQYEAYIRGAWIRRCATEVDIDRLYRQDELPKIWTMIKALEAVIGFESGLLSDYQSKNWSALNSFTHGGTHQIQRRMKVNELAANYTEGDAISILQNSNNLAFITAGEICVAANNIELAHKNKECFMSTL